MSTPGEQDERLELAMRLSIKVCNVLNDSYSVQYLSRSPLLQQTYQEQFGTLPPQYLKPKAKVNVKNNALNNNNNNNNHHHHISNIGKKMNDSAQNGDNNNNNNNNNKTDNALDANNNQMEYHQANNGVFNAQNTKYGDPNLVQVASLNDFDPAANHRDDDNKMENVASNAEYQGDDEKSQRGILHAHFRNHYISYNHIDSCG